MQHSSVQHKEHFHVLDGLRGAAALGVLLFHYVEIFFMENPADNPMGHGFLAVDFFFCLSGFVIGYAYDDRIPSIGAKRFFINRLIRLHPLVVFATLIGTATVLFDPFFDVPLQAGRIPISLAFLGSLFLIPTPLLPGTGNCIFPYNSPAWSLFYEYVISIFYALVLIRIPKRVLPALVSVFAAVLVVVTKDYEWINLGWNGATLWPGSVRVAYGFTAGLMIFRFGWMLKVPGGFFPPLVLLIMVLFFPHSGSDWIRESFLVIIAIPVTVAIGAGALTQGLGESFSRFFGKLSYPLYMTHIPTVSLFWHYLWQNDLNGAPLYMTVSVLIVFNLVFAYAIMRFFDEPVRNWLRLKLVGRHSRLG